MNKIFLFLSISLLLVGIGNGALAQSDDRLAVLDTTQGTIVIEFFPDDAPNHVDNFIGLAESEFYDGTLFHRIIPGFMIQGGDPYTISGESSMWGQRGQSTSVDAEFNTIMHNRGIVSMARSTDPDSAGSQFFIVHQDSNFLDENYTVFGRIVTDESFETLDKIASVETGTNDIPADPQSVKINKIIISSRSDIPDVLELPEPDRTGSAMVTTLGSQKYQSEEHQIEFTAPEGWLLQTPDATDPNAPDIVAVGPKTGVVNPVISLTIQETDKTLDDIVSEKNAMLKLSVESNSLEITSQNKITVQGREAYVINAQETFTAEDQSINVKFREIVIYDTIKIYTLTYSNGQENFDSQLSKFEETVDSLKILSVNTPTPDTSEKEGGGCLIATATFGSELAPQVQQLRELRDNTILSTTSGMAFISEFNQFYYSFSPTIADLERQNPMFKEAVKLSLTPMLSTLSILNHADIDSEAEMITYGVSVILLNVGMYIVAPAIIIYKIRK